MWWRRRAPVFSDSPVSDVEKVFCFCDCHRWRQWRDWRCLTKSNKPSTGPRTKWSAVFDTTTRTPLSVHTCTAWSEGTDNTGELSSSRSSACLMTALWVVSSSTFVSPSKWKSFFTAVPHLVVYIKDDFFSPTQKTEVTMLLFIADNFACFPYQTQEEPLFIMHHIDIALSVSGSNLLQSFKEVRNIVTLVDV